jgi:1-acyl-sn-glycerol-3-phosphate acyltransferase
MVGSARAAGSGKHHNGWVESPNHAKYDELLSRGHAIYPGMRLGKPGRARTYWATIFFMRLLNLRWSVKVTGASNVAAGPAILVGNHVSAMDPVAIVMKQWWRVTAFAKVEVFENRGAVFFRWMGQIPLRRGDEQATRWALDVAAQVMADGSKLGLYPEGTRSPDKKSLHKLHRRILIPVLESNPGVPVHAIATTYLGTKFGRKRVEVNLSAPLPIDVATMHPNEVVEIMKNSLLDLGGMDYVDAFARDLKAQAS